MARVYTPKQMSAIETRDRTLLVSAAAGAGKTATLTERIIRSILDEQDPINISDMLIVTFTRAAAADMRARLAVRRKCRWTKRWLRCCLRRAARWRNTDRNGLKQ